jgi:1-deoxy-D-xylulose-5-phosphate reductoisomerase
MPSTNFRKAFSLDFTPPEYAKYPCLQLAFNALRAGDAAPAIFNAANEVAVERFLAKEISYLEIPQLIEHSLTKVVSPSSPSLDQLFQIDTETRDITQSHNP